MNRTSAWCVIAHSERLKRFMDGTPVDRMARRLNVSALLSTVARTLLPGLELLHAERDDAVAVA